MFVIGRDVSLILICYHDLSCFLRSLDRLTSYFETNSELCTILCLCLHTFFWESLASLTAVRNSFVWRKMSTFAVDIIGMDEQASQSKWALCFELIQVTTLQSCLVNQCWNDGKLCNVKSAQLKSEQLTGLWEVAGVPRENPWETHRDLNSPQRPRLRFEPEAFLLCGDGANQHTNVQPA